MNLCEACGDELDLGPNPVAGAISLVCDGCYEAEVAA